MIGTTLTSLLLLAAPPDGARVIMDADRGVPKAVFRLQVQTQGSTPQERAVSFLRSAGPWLGGISTAQLKFEKVSRLGDAVVVYFQLLSGGVPVDSRFIAVRLDSSGRVRRVQSDFDRWRVPPVRAGVSEEKARRVALEHAGGTHAGHAEQVVLPTGPGAGLLAWRVHVAPVPLQRHFRVFVGAQSGEVIFVERGMKDQRGELPR